MLFNPKTPAHIRKAMTENPSRSGYGWDMDKGICNFEPRFNVGDKVKVLVISNERTNEKFINENTKIEYLVGEVTGYYDVGYGILVKKIIYQQNTLYGFYDIGGHHTLYHDWVEEKPYNKRLINQMNKIRHKQKVFVFR